MSNASSKFGHVRFLPVDSVQPSPENSLIYRAISAADPDVIRLAESIQRHGILEHLVVTEDGYILSGHRRHFAARLAGLKKIPCRVDGVSRDDEAFRRRLVEHNQQRVKGVEELIQEELFRADPQADYDQLLSE